MEGLGLTGPVIAVKNSGLTHQWAQAVLLWAQYHLRDPPADLWPDERALQTLRHMIPLPQDVPAI